MEAVHGVSFGVYIRRIMAEVEPVGPDFPVPAPEALKEQPTMSTDELSLGAEFPQASRKDWEALAAKTLGDTPLEKLNTRTYDGIEVQPLYLAEDWNAEGDPSGFPGDAPFTRGSKAVGGLQGWGVEPEVLHPSVEAANDIILADLQRGASGVTLRLDRAARRGLSADSEDAGEEGLLMHSVQDLDRVLNEVLLDLIPVRLQAGGSFPGAAAMLAAVWRRRGLEAKDVKGNLGADPIGTLASEGELPTSLETQLEAATALAHAALENWPGVTTFGVDVSRYHDAGATEAQELGCALATGLVYLKELIRSGMDVDHACRQIEFTLTADEQFFTTIARLRAARLVWARMTETCGASEDARAMRLRAVTAERMMTRRDPWVNLLRTTAACFAAGVAGAEGVTVRPFNAALGLPDAFGRRLARNTQMILQEEASLNRVIDPAGGSWYMESLTEAIARAAWREFQAIEAEGGMIEAVRGGKIQKRIASAAAAREKNIGKRKDPITGVSEFPNLGEPPVEVEEVDRGAIRRAAAEARKNAKAGAIGGEAREKLAALDIDAWIKAAEAGHTLAELNACLGGQREEARALERRRKAESFEALRDASDAELEKSGKRPQIFLANMGRIAQHTARATFARNFFEAGGVEAITNEGFMEPADAAKAFQDSGAKLAILCGSDVQYGDSAVAFAKALKSAGVERLYLAGRPGELEGALKEAGVDEFISMGCDVLGTLRGALGQLGVIER